MKRLSPMILRKVASVAAQKILADFLTTSTARRLLGTVTHVETDDTVAALTFDDGPHPETTPQVLDVLKKHRARATFFMLGEAAQNYPDLVRQVAEAGHAIGNHSWDHPSFPLVARRERLRQVRACARALAPYGQRLFRPPYGEQNLASRLDLLTCRYKVITWNMNTGDWCNPDEIQMADWIVEKIRPGSVVLLHDTISRPRWRERPKPLQQTNYHRGAMLAALDMALDRLGDRFRFVTIPELLRQGRSQRTIWYQSTEPIVS